MNALLNDDFCEIFQELNMPILDSEVIWAGKELKYSKSCGENLVLNEFSYTVKITLLNLPHPFLISFLTVVILYLYINAAIVLLPTTSKESHCSVFLVNYSQETSTTALTSGLKYMVSISRHSLDLAAGDALLTVYMCCTCWLKSSYRVCALLSITQKRLTMLSVKTCSISSFRVGLKVKNFIS